MLEKYINFSTKYVRFYFLVEVLLLLLLLLRAAAAAHNISTEAERGTAYCFFLLRLRYYYCCFLCVYSIAVAVAAVEKGYAFLFFGRGAAAANRFLVGCADAAAGACAAYNISTEAERGTGYCFLLLRFCPLPVSYTHLTLPTTPYV